MAYSNKAYFQKMLTVEDYDEVIPNDESLDLAIAEADNEINGYLMSRAEVPLSPVPEKIRGCSFDLAVYILYKKLPGSQTPLKRKEAYDEAVSYLTKISKGTILLFPVQAESESAISTDFGGDDPKFSMDMF